MVKTPDLLRVESFAELYGTTSPNLHCSVLSFPGQPAYRLRNIDVTANSRPHGAPIAAHKSRKEQSESQWLDKAETWLMLIPFQAFQPRSEKPGDEA